jgi:peptidoglycan biosynthesis protein MviN/MurJ (putative lipid II flippase)
MFAPAVLLMGIGRVPYGLAYARKRVGPLFVSAVLSSAALVVSEALFIYAGLGMRSFGLGSTVAGAVSLTWLYFKVIRREPAQMLDKTDALKLAAVGLSAWAGAALMAWLAGMLLPSVASRNLVMLAAGLLGCGLFFVVAAWALNFSEVRKAPAVLKRLWQKRFRR